MMFWCEIKRDGQWTKIHISESPKSFREHPKRCIECGGRLCQHRPYQNGTPAHFEHMKVHTGCSLIPYSYKGIRSRHPDALD